VASRSSADLQRILVAHASDIEGVVRRYVDTEMDRDDLRQEIAIAVWRALPRFLGNSSERTYIVRIAQNRAISYRLRLARNRALFHDLGDDDVAIASHSGEFDIRRAYASVRDAMTALPAAQHDVLALYAEGYTPRQIASKTGRSSGAIRVALHRARETVRRILGRETNANRGATGDHGHD
jgi:RNA polymerase sigma-70 factor (ECF subfamily)